MKAAPAIELKTISKVGTTPCIALDLGRGIKVYHPVKSEQEAIERYGFVHESVG